MMAKILRKTLAWVSSAAIMATMITVPTVANAADATISYSDGYATATASGKLIAASYNDDGTLAKVKLYDAEAGTPAAVDVAEGGKLMLWNGLDTEGMKPLSGAYDVPAAAVTTEAPEELNIKNTWKFDFGSAEDVADGFTAVTADVNYTLNTAGDYQYGFIGTNEKDYKLNGGHIDGFVQQEGQVIELTAGGGTGLNDAIGSTGEDAYGNAGDKYYPTRFALKVTENGYYRVKATVTTLDPAKAATASLYTERKHPLYTEKTIPAGETVTTEFTIRPTAIYYKGPATTYSDDMVNVCVLGENTALAALEVYQIETAPVLWVLGDSTVTDGGGSLPFFPLQNYTGVGTGLTKYLPKNIAMVNEGEGGLAANDNQHYNMVAKNIKAGDFMYVEYGHNHKSDGVSGYLSSLSKYYNKCKEVGATLILVGPIDRHNDGQYNATTNAWSSTLGGYSKAAKAYVDLMLWGGETAASTFVSKYSANDSETVAAAYQYADGILAGEKTSDITNVAFVDLNQPSLDWLASITAGGTVAGTKYTNDIRLADYYFRGAKNTSHNSVDGTHPNDAGAENLAYFFYSTADTDAYPALEPLMTRFKAGRAEKPTPVSQSILDLGWAGNAAWPEYVTVSYDYPLVIKKLVTDEDGNITGMDVYKQDSMDTYASGVLVIDGTQYVTAEHIDNTWDNKNTYTISFAEPIALAEGVEYKAYMWSCSLEEERLLTEEEGGKKLSANYVPAEYDAYLLPGEDSDIETFDYYGKTDLVSTGKYTFKGSTGSDFTLGTDDGRTYANIVSTGGGSSYWLYRKLESETGTNGRYIIEADIKYNSGYNGNALEVALAPSITNNSPYVNNPYELFTIGSGGALSVNGTSVGSLTALNWTNVRYILDMNAGTASVSINGGDPVVVARGEYASFDDLTIGSMNYFVFTTATRSAAFNIQFSNLTVAKIADGGRATISVAVDGESADMGTVYTGEEGVASQTVSTASTVTATASAAEGYAFVGWYEGETLFSDEAELSIARLYRDLSLTAKFRVQTLPATVTVNYVDEDGNSLKDGETITEVDGKTIYSQTAFALTDTSYTAAIKAKNENGLYDVYLYNSEKSDSLSIASLAEDNTINIVFSKQTDEYFEYEDFTDETVGKWGFTEGRSGNVFISNGALTIYNGSGTSASQQTSDVKTFDDAIQAAKQLNVSFDWRNTSGANGRYSYFNLYDSNENIIFSLRASLNTNIFAVGEAAGSVTNISGAAANWHRVQLSIDFEAGTVSGTITDLTTGAVTTITETSIAASNLAAMKTVYGYSAAPQAIDNVGIGRMRAE